MQSKKRKGRGCAPPNREVTRWLLGWRARRRDRFARASQNIYAPESAWETIAIGIVLIATGLILVGGDYLGVLSLDNVRNLWPMGLIAIGLVDLNVNSGRQG
jgi:hypothetical protein